MSRPMRNLPSGLIVELMTIKLNTTERILAATVPSLDSTWNMYALKSKSTNDGSLRRVRAKSSWRQMASCMKCKNTSCRPPNGFWSIWERASWFSGLGRISSKKMAMIVGTTNVDRLSWPLMVRIVGCCGGWTVLLLPIPPVLLVPGAPVAMLIEVKVLLQLERQHM